MEDIIYPKTKVYIKVDNNNNVVDINSSIFVKDTDGWIYIDEGYGDKYDHAQSLYLNKPLINEKGQYNYNFHLHQIYQQQHNTKSSIEITKGE